MTFTDADIEKIRKFGEILDRGHFADIGDIADTYNRIHSDEANFVAVKPTNCGSCNRQRVLQMREALSSFEKRIEKEKEEEEKKKKETGQPKTISNYFD